MSLLRKYGFFFLLLLAPCISAQMPTQLQPKTEATASERVYLEHSETLSFDEDRLPDAQILRGNVCFRHEEAFMYCDSAYFYSATNSVTAFGHVRFEQGDTLHGEGAILYYDGNTKLARLCRNVSLRHRNTTLTTDSLNYDRNIDKAYYFTGGTIKDGLNLLTSLWGEYSPTTHDAFFQTDVHLSNDKFTLDAPKLLYNTATYTAQLIAPTVIVYQGETTIRSSRGWYNTSTERSMLLDRSVIEHQNGKFLTGDTIFYDKKQGFGQLFMHMQVKDTVQKATLYGNYGEVWEHDRRGYVTDSAMLEDWSQPKSTFLHADSLFTEEVPYVDSLLGDTTFRQLRAFRHVRVYSDDYQVVCDSLSYNGRDSIIILHHQPLCWSENNQISADSITVYIRNGKIDHAYGVGSALGVKQESPDFYDQLSGKEIFAYLHNGKLQRVDVVGNAETIFYPQDDDQEFVGVNKTQSSHVQIFFENNKIHHVLFTTETTGTMYPLSQIAPKDTFFPVFFWAVSERPTCKDDIFLTPSATPRPTSTTISATDEDDKPKAKTVKPKRNKQRKN